MRWYDAEAMVSQAELIVYTRPDCTYSDALLHDLKKDGVEYREIDLEEHPELVEELEQLTGGERVTPVMVEENSSSWGIMGSAERSDRPGVAGASYRGPVV